MRHQRQDPASYFRITSRKVTFHSVVLAAEGDFEGVQLGGEVPLIGGGIVAEHADQHLGSGFAVRRESQLLDASEQMNGLIGDEVAPRITCHLFSPIPLASR